MMKKLSILAVAFAAIAFAACGNKSASNTESADSVVKSFEQEQKADKGREAGEARLSAESLCS